MKKYKNRKDAVKTVVAVLCAALMLTACGSKETTSNETAKDRDHLCNSYRSNRSRTDSGTCRRADRSSHGIRNSSQRDCSCRISCTCRGTHSSTRRIYCCKHRVYLFGIKPDHVCKVRSKCQRPAQYGW